MAKKSKEKRSGVSGKMIFGVVLAVGSAVAAYVASKFLSKKGELAQPNPEYDTDMEMTEDNYITLENDVDEAPQAAEEAAEMVEEAAEAAEEVVEDAEDAETPAQEEPAPEAADDLTKCIRD